MSDFKTLAAEADDQREREMKTRKEAQRLKLEIDQQTNECEADEPSSSYTTTTMSDSTFSSKYSSRTSSIEPVAADLRIRQLEDQNKEYKLAFIRLDEEKEILTYQLGLIRDQNDDLSENIRLFQKEIVDKKKQCSYQKCQIDELCNRMKFLKDQIELRDQLITDNKLILFDDNDLSSDLTKPIINQTTDALKTDNNNLLNSDVNIKISGTALLSKDVIDMLKELSENSLECCIRRLFDERQKYLEEIKVLRRQVDDEKDDLEINSGKKDSKKKHNGDDFETLKQNYHNVKNQCQEYKRQYQLAQQKVTVLEADVASRQNKVIRIEGQVKRYKSIADSCEKQEEELKQSKRKYQREVREAQSKIEDLKSENAALTKKIEKLMKQLSKKENNN